MECEAFDDDPITKKKFVNLRESVKKIEGILDKLSDENIYNNLSLKEKIDHDLFMAYTLNTLYWLYLRIKNEDPNENDIKNQINRVKEYMVKAKQAHERQTIRPKIDQGAAQRFIKHGINYKDKDRTDKSHPPNKKIKFSD